MIVYIICFVVGMYDELPLSDMADDHSVTYFDKILNLLKPETYFMYRQLQHSKVLCSAHNAFICFARISEQTAIISLYSIN